MNGSYKNDADPVGKLHQAIANYIGNNNGECEALAAPFAVFLNEDDMNYVEPDISVICDLSKLDDKGCHGAPDWVIEIVSPSSKPRDYMAKLFKYRMAGVRDCLYYNRNHSLYG